VSLFSRWVAPVYLRIGEEHVIHVYLGETLVWDGTVPAVVSSPRATATAQAIAPVISSTADALTPPDAEASAAAIAPSVSASSVVSAPIATASAVAIPIITDRAVSAPVATATAMGHVPDVATTGSNIVAAPTATASAMAPVPDVAASKNVVAVTATASAAATAPAIIKSETVTAPTATASAAATAPAVAGVNFSDMGMDKSGTFAMSSNTTAKVTGWAARSGFPSTVITNNELDSDGSASVTINCKVTLTGSWGFASALTLRVMKSGSLLASTTIAFGATSATFSPISTSLTGTDTVYLEYSTPFGTSGTIQSGSTNTYLYYND